MPGGTELIITGDHRAVVLGGADLFPLTIRAHGVPVAVRVFDAEGTELEALEAAKLHTLEWPGGDGDAIELEIERRGSVVPRITVPRERDQALPQSTQLSWPAGQRHGLYEVKVVEKRPGSPTIDRRTFLASPALQPWAPLDGEQAYRAIVREHNGRDYVAAICDLHMEPVSGGYPAALGDWRALVDTLRAALSERQPLPEKIYEIPESADTRAFAVELGEMARVVTEETPRIAMKAAGLDYAGLAQTVQRLDANPDGSVFLREVLRYLALLGAVDAFATANGLRGRDPWLVPIDPAQAATLRSMVKAHSSYRAGSFSSLIVEAWTVDATDRAAAAALREQAAAANPTLFATLWIEVGANTYVSQRWLDEHRDLGARLKASVPDPVALTPLPAYDGSEHLYFISTDARYFGMYFPAYLATAQFFAPHGIRAHFLINETVEVAEEVARRARRLIAAAADLRAADATALQERISFAAQPPPQIPEVRTFYACSRYLSFDHIADAWGGPIVVADIDLWFTHDPRDYLAALPKDKIGIQTVSTKFEGLRGWRRYIASTMLIPGTDAGRRFIGHMGDYIWPVLPREWTWMLDQNALTYAVERLIADGEAGELHDISRAGRPTASHPIKGLLSTQGPVVIVPPSGAP